MEDSMIDWLVSSFKNVGIYSLNRTSFNNLKMETPVIHMWCCAAVVYIYLETQCNVSPMNNGTIAFIHADVKTRLHEF